MSKSILLLLARFSAYDTLQHEMYSALLIFIFLSAGAFRAVVAKAPPLVLCKDQNCESCPVAVASAGPAPRQCQKYNILDVLSDEKFTFNYDK